MQHLQQLLRFSFVLVFIGVIVADSEGCWSLRVIFVRSNDIVYSLHRFSGIYEGLRICEEIPIMQMLVMCS